MMPVGAYGWDVTLVLCYRLWRGSGWCR